MSYLEILFSIFLRRAFLWSEGSVWLVKSSVHTAGNLHSIRFPPLTSFILTMSSEYRFRVMPCSEFNLLSEPSPSELLNKHTNYTTGICILTHLTQCFLMKVVLRPERILNRLKGNQAKFKPGNTLTFYFSDISFYRR